MLEESKEVYLRHPAGTRILDLIVFNSQNNHAACIRAHYDVLETQTLVIPKPALSARNLLSAGAGDNRCLTR